MSIQTNLNNLVNQITEMQRDAEKHDRGQNAAGTRLRKNLLDLQRQASALRRQIQEERQNRRQDQGQNNPGQN